MDYPFQLDNNWLQNLHTSSFVYDMDPLDVPSYVLMRVPKEQYYSTSNLPETMEQVLLQYNGDILQRDMFGNSAIHNLLMQGGCLELIKSLLDMNADVNSAGYFDYSPLQLAILGNHPLETVGMIIMRGANLDHSDRSGQTALHLVASRESCKPILELLLFNGADVHVKDVRGQTPLHFASSRISSPEIVNLLLDYGATVSDQDTNGQTPLHLPFVRNSRHNPNFSVCSKIIMMLFENASDDDVNIQDNKGKTPLHLVACSSRYNINILQDLLNFHKSSLAILDSDGCSPVDIALRHRQAMKVVMRYILKFKCANLPIDVTHELDFSHYDVELNIYLEELETMKLYKFGQFSLHDIFSRSKDPSYFNNEQFVVGVENTFTSPDLKEKFPCYESLLKKVFRNRKYRYRLLNEAHKLFPVMIPEEIRRLVFLYLNNKDLENFIKAQSPTKQ